MSTEIKDDEEDISNIKEYFGISEEEIICQENTAGEVRKLENMSSTDMSIVTPSLSSTEVGKV